MFAPGVNVSRANLSGLKTPEQILQEFNPERFLKRLEKLILKSIKMKIRETAFTPAAKKRLLKGMTTKLGPRSVTVVATDPAFRPLLEGQKPMQMKWLVKAKAPIPIVLDSGEVIFRSATAKSMTNGSWYHPGRKDTRIVERAKKEARAVVRKEIKKLLKQHLRSEMRKMR